MLKSFVDKQMGLKLQISPLSKKSIVGKGESIDSPLFQHFFLTTLSLALYHTFLTLNDPIEKTFSHHVFYPITGRRHYFSYTNLSSANAFNLAQSMILLFGRELRSLTLYKNDKILFLTKLKAFADDKFNAIKMIISVFDRLENILGKGEHFLFISQHFQNIFVSGL